MGFGVCLGEENPADAFSCCQHSVLLGWEEASTVDWPVAAATLVPTASRAAKTG